MRKFRKKRTKIIRNIAVAFFVLLLLIITILIGPGHNYITEYSILARTLQTLGSAVTLAYFSDTVMESGEFSYDSSEIDKIVLFGNHRPRKEDVKYFISFDCNNKRICFGLTSEWLREDEHRQSIMAQIAERSWIYQDASGTKYKEGSTIMRCLGPVDDKKTHLFTLAPEYDSETPCSHPADGVHVRVVLKDRRYEGAGDSVRAAVADALKKRPLALSGDITELSVATQNGYVLHELDPRICSDDFGFIRASLTKLRGLDLSGADFMYDTLPRSALNSSHNIVYPEIPAGGDMKNLRTLILPASVKTIGAAALRDAANLRTVYAPGVETIREKAFEGCTSLAAVYMPNAREVGDCAFFRCESLESICLPRAEKMGDRVFAGCRSLDIAAIPRAEAIGDIAGPPDSYKDCSIIQPRTPRALVLGERALMAATQGRSPGSQVLYVESADAAGSFPGWNIRSCSLPELRAHAGGFSVSLRRRERYPLSERLDAAGAAAVAVVAHSQDPRVAEIDARGTITARRRGATKITVDGYIAALALEREPGAGDIFAEWPVTFDPPLEIALTVN